MMVLNQSRAAVCLQGINSRARDGNGSCPAEMSVSHPGIRAVAGRAAGTGLSSDRINTRGKPLCRNLIAQGTRWIPLAGLTLDAAHAPASILEASACVNGVTSILYKANI